MNSDSPASSSSSLGIKSKIIPTVASHWKLPHLEKFGILYADKPSTISELLNHANSFAETKQDVKSIPRLSNVLMEFCRNLWTISYDFRNQSWLEAREKIFEVDKLKANFELREKEMTENIKDRLGVDYKMMRFFHYWSMNMLEFWTYFGDLLGRFKKDYQREERFTYLFMAFSKMFFLRPEGGEAYTTSIKIKAVDVRGMPDIRYIMPRKGETGEKLFIVTEVKKYNAFRGEYTADTFTYKNISNYVLGQHGIELIMERKESHLFPGVLGMICIGTQTKKQRILGFVICLLMGTFCFSLASLYIPVLVLKARKFAVLYTLGSLFVISSFSLLWGPMNHIKHLFSSSRLPFTAVYFGTIFATLYFSLWARSTIFTVICAVIQVLALVWYIVSYIPGGQTGLRFFSKVFYAAASKTVQKTLPV